MEPDEYRTLEKAAEGFYKEKGSKFIAHAFTVISTEEVKDQLEILRKQYHDARHHCYAYRLGPEPYEIRFNDDGEPSGTAGKPIFGQIQSYDLTNILIVVIRYFGGVKLGTGGLIQAYRTASRAALDNAEIITKTWNIIVKVRFQYARMDQVMRIIKEEECGVIHQESYEDCSITLEIRAGKSEQIKTKMKNIEKLEWRVI